MVQLNRATPSTLTPIARHVCLCLLLLHGCCSLEKMGKRNGSRMFIWTPWFFSELCIAFNQLISKRILWPCSAQWFDLRTPLAESRSGWGWSSILYPRKSHMASLLAITRTWWTHNFCDCCWIYKAGTKLGWVKSPFCSYHILIIQ